MTRIENSFVIQKITWKSCLGTKFLGKLISVTKKAFSVHGETHARYGGWSCAPTKPPLLFQAQGECFSKVPTAVVRTCIPVFSPVYDCTHTQSLNT